MDEYLYSGTVWSGGDIVQTGSDGQLTGMVTLDGNKSNEGVSVTLSNSENNYTAVTDADGDINLVILNMVLIF